MKEFIKLLIGASEKAANIARIIRNEKELFSLLVQEKEDDEKNVRFLQDFKTLADVLIQESLRCDISHKYPEMKDNIYGEENNTFSNTLGETITVIIQDTAEKTAELLSKVIDGSSQAAKLLADEIHKEMEIHLNEEDEEALNLPTDLVQFKDIGIWIDPIDGTNEYIKGSEKFDISSTSNDQIWPSGLHCVTVLIGAFHLQSGQPLVGIINQPFYSLDDSTKTWKGRYFWGLNIKDHLKSSPVLKSKIKANEEVAKSESKKIAILSSSEDPILQNKLKMDFELVFSAGAGYKLLCVALGLVDIYVLSKNTTHFWDTCGPHAILSAIGGGIICYKDLVKHQNSPLDLTCSSSVKNLKDICYKVEDKNAKDSHYANLGGIVAYKNHHILHFIRDYIHLS